MKTFLDIVKDESTLNGAIKESYGYKLRELNIRQIQLEIDTLNLVPLCKDICAIYSLEKKLLEAKKDIEDYIKF